MLTNPSKACAACKHSCVNHKQVGGLRSVLYQANDVLNLDDPEDAKLVATGLLATERASSESGA